MTVPSVFSWLPYHWPNARLQVTNEPAELGVEAKPLVALVGGRPRLHQPLSQE